LPGKHFESRLAARERLSSRPGLAPTIFSEAKKAAAGQLQEAERGCRCAAVPLRLLGASFQFSCRPYSLTAFSNTIFEVTFSGTPAKSAAITLRELGQVQSPCGKSDAHM